jgi:hypothetical protein
MFTFRPDRSLLAIVGIIAGFNIPAALAWQAPDAPTMQPKIVVLEGDEGVNVVKKKIAVRPVVEVRDQYDFPIAGAAVQFWLPKSGSGGVFTDGSRELSLVTDSRGRAAMAEMRPLGNGDFKIGVRATYEGRSATITISQTNFATVAAAKNAGKVPGTSASAPADTASLTLPSSAMAMKGGSAALLVVGVGAAGAATYFLLKNKSTVPVCVLNSLQSTLTQDVTATTDCEDTETGCSTDVNATYAALSAYCACSNGSFASVVSAATLTALGITTLPAACSTGN